MLRLKPDYAPAHFCIAFACLYSKRIDEAVARFREGLRYGPDDAEAHYGLGSALAMQRKREDAVSELREALRLRPDYAEAQQLLPTRTVNANCLFAMYARHDCSLCYPVDVNGRLANNRSPRPCRHDQGRTIR